MAATPGGPTHCGSRHGGSRHGGSTHGGSTFDEQVAERMLTANMDDGLPGFLGFRHVEFGDGRLRAEMDAKPELMTAFGNLHGGCISAFVDHCLGVLFYPMIPRGAWVATTEFKLNLLRAVNGGTCVAEATVIAMTRRQGVARIEVVNDDQLVCVAQGTVTIVQPRGDTRSDKS